MKDIERARGYGDKKRLKCGDTLIPCAICGRKFRQVGSHVVAVHGYSTARDYRRDFGFDVKKGQLSPKLRKKKADIAINNGTTNNLRIGAQFRFIKGDKRAGKYKRSRETTTRLKNSFIEIHKLFKQEGPVRQRWLKALSEAKKFN